MADATEISPTEYEYLLDDSTQGWSFSRDVDVPSGYSGEDLTSEVITEDPTDGSTGQQYTLADLSKASYTDAMHFSPTTQAFYSSSNTQPVEMILSNGNQADTVSSISSDGTLVRMGRNVTGGFRG